MIDGCTQHPIGPCENPQSVLAMTFSEPTNRACRANRSVTTSGCYTTFVACLMTPGFSTVPSGTFTVSHTRHSCSWRGLLAPIAHRLPTLANHSFAISRSIAVIEWPTGST
jgi:hypothetical protein